MIEMVKLLALVALVAGCEANLGSGGDNNGSGLDAAGSGETFFDAAVQQQIDAAAPACANGRKVFLNFDGVTLTKAATTDATTNTAAWMTNASAVVPRYHTAVAGRDTEITSIVDGVKARLSALPLQVVTTRPTSGSYVMIVMGGNNTTNGGTIGSQYSFATSDHDCGDVVKNDIAWIADLPATTYAPDLVLGALGWAVGLNGTSDPNGCMCGWANACAEADTVACTLSASIASTTSSGNTTCPNQNPQNEVAALSTGFCQ
jgi:hypothetical protein